MNYLIEAVRSFGFAGSLAQVRVCGVGRAPHAARAQANDLGQLVDGSSLCCCPAHRATWAWNWRTWTQEKAQALKLKEVRGAIITLIDHDAPAGQIGLKVNDVVLQLNGQNVEGAEQLRSMLKEIPSGRKVSIEISRDGNIQTLAVELADRQVLGTMCGTRSATAATCLRRCRAWAFLPAAATCRRRRRISYAVLRQQPERGRAG